MIKNICIFMLIAQAVLFFVPGNSYMKYVRVLVGILMIMGIVGPLFELFTDSTVKDEILQEQKALTDQIGDLEGQMEAGEETMAIYSGIEEEIRERLAETDPDYTVQKVTLMEEKDHSLRIELTVARKDRKIWVSQVEIGQKDTKEEERLRTVYAESLSISPEQIELILK